MFATADALFAPSTTMGGTFPYSPYSKDADEDFLIERFFNDDDMVTPMFAFEDAQPAVEHPSMQHGNIPLWPQSAQQLDEVPVEMPAQLPSASSNQIVSRAHSNDHHASTGDEYVPEEDDEDEDDEAPAKKKSKAPATAAKKITRARRGTRTPEERAQAVLEKNRRAQKRFRERSKQRAKEVEVTMASLTEQVEKLTVENSTMKSRTTMLEKVVALRDEQIQQMQEEQKVCLRVNKRDVDTLKYVYLHTMLIDPPITSVYTTPCTTGVCIHARHAPPNHVQHPRMHAQGAAAAPRRHWANPAHQPLLRPSLCRIQVPRVGHDPLARRTRHGNRRRREKEYCTAIADHRHRHGLPVHDGSHAQPLQCQAIDGRRGAHARGGTQAQQ